MKHKIFLLIHIIYIIGASTSAQPVIKHQTTIGGDLDDYLTSMDLTKDGGLIAGGYSLSNRSKDKTQNSRGKYDYWIVKLDSMQNIQWDKTIGGKANDYLMSLQQTSDGGYIAGGHSFSNISGQKTDSNRGNADFWVVKLNRRGVIQWDKTIGGSGIDRLHAVQQTKDGGYILGGTSDSNISGEKTENTHGYYDFWVVKLDKAGNIAWNKTIGGDSSDYLKFLKQTKDGGYLLAGTSSSNKSGNKSENSRGLIDYWIVKLNSAGNIEWDKTIGGADNEYCRSVLETQDGGYIVAGNSFSNRSGEKTENSRGNSDYWIVKMDKFRTIQWDKTIGGSNEDALLEGLFSFAITSDSGYILGGYSYSDISGEKTENSRGGADYWIVKLNKRGHVQWDKTIGGNSDDELSSIQEFEKNRYRLAGYSNSSISGDKKQNSKGGYDYWLVYMNHKKENTAIIYTYIPAYKIKDTQHKR